MNLTKQLKNLLKREDKKSKEFAGEAA